MAGVTEMHGGSPTPLAPSGACGSGSSTSDGHDVGRVEAGRQQVVGEAGVADAAVDRWTISSITASPSPWAMPPSIWPMHRQRVERPPDVLGGGHLHHLHQPELDVDVDDGAVGDEGERGVAVALTVVVEVLRRAVVVLDGLVEDARRRWPRRRAPAATPSVSTTSVPSISEPQRVDAVRAGPRARTGARAPPGRRRRPRRPSSTSGATPTSTRPNRCAVSIGSSTTSSTPSTVRAICSAIVTKPWPDLGGGELERGDAVGQPAAGRGVVVEALGVHEVLDRHARSRRPGGRGRRRRCARRRPAAASGRRRGRRPARRASAAPRSRGCSGRPAPRSPRPGR